MDQHYIGNPLVQCWPRQIQTTMQIFFVQLVCEVWANIVQVFFLCNVGSGRSRQHSIWLFSYEKMTVWSGTTLHQYLSCVMFSQMY